MRHEMPGLIILWPRIFSDSVFFNQWPALNFSAVAEICFPAHWLYKYNKEFFILLIVELLLRPILGPWFLHRFIQAHFLSFPKVWEYCLTNWLYNKCRMQIFALKITGRHCFKWSHLTWIGSLMPYLSMHFSI